MAMRPSTPLSTQIIIAISARRARSAPATRFATGKSAIVANRTAKTSYLSTSAVADTTDCETLKDAKRNAVAVIHATTAARAFHVELTLVLLVASTELYVRAPSSQF